MNGLKGRKHRQKGAASLEFALILIFLLMPLIVGIVDVGRLMTAQQILNRAVREGAVQLSRSNDYDTAIKSFVEDAGLDPTKVSISIDDGGQAHVTGTEITITVGYALDDFPLFPMLSQSFMPTGVQTTATLRHE